METQHKNSISNTSQAGLDNRARWTRPHSNPDLEHFHPSHFTTAIIPATPSILSTVSPTSHMRKTSYDETARGRRLDSSREALSTSSDQNSNPEIVGDELERINSILSLLSEDVVCAYLNQHPDFVKRFIRTADSTTFANKLDQVHTANQALSSVDHFVVQSTTTAQSKSLSTSPSQVCRKLSSASSKLAMSTSCSTGNKLAMTTLGSTGTKPAMNTSSLSNSNELMSKVSPVLQDRKLHLRTKNGDLLTEPEMFMELIRDISTELDIDTLCHKILVNVGHLTHADRASLFLTQGQKQNRFLVAKLFDVTVDSKLSEVLRNSKEREIHLPWGVGIVGHVARTKEIINIKDAYQDSRFDASVDERTGYHTESVLCMPVCNFDGDVIGVAQIINKKNGTKEFTEQDVEVFRRYLAFCGIGVQNAQLFDLSMKEYKRNQMLLQLAKGIFSEQTSLDRLVSKIMMDATDILKCERCFVYLLNSQNTSDRYRKGSQTNDVMEESLHIKFTDLHRGLSCSLDYEGEEPTTVAIPDKEEISENQLVILDNPSPTHVLNHKPLIKFYTAFELRYSRGESRILRHSPTELSVSPHAALAGYVCDEGKTLNISDVQDWLGYPLEENSLLTFNVLTMPIFDSKRQILGVAQMINKENGLPFTEYDMSTFEAFATFCGMGIQNTQVYENACRLMARQKVALECLSYHATASKEDTDLLRQVDIPSAKDFGLYSYDFNDLNLSDMDTCKCAVRMFVELNLLDTFSISYEVMCRWILSVKKNYRPVKYHNWRHALTVAQTMFAILKTGKIEKFVNDLEMLGLLVACLSHDLDHRGTNNSFQTKTDSPLAILYSTSTMEHHHFDQCVMILSQDSNNIFQSLSAEDYRKVMKLVENAILSTDMGLYFKKKNSFLELSDNGEFDWQSPDKKELLCGMMMTACDVSAIAKPWEVQHKVAKLVADEFFEQGDLEKLKLNQEPMAMMDRDKRDELPKMQVGFIDYICLPLYKALSDSFPWVKPLYDGCARNKEQWQILADQVDMGLTWIDHEYIDKPVERNETEIINRITLNSKSTVVPCSPPKKSVFRGSVSTITGATEAAEPKDKMKRSIKLKFGRKATQEASKASEAESIMVEESPTAVESTSILQSESRKKSKRKTRFCSLL